MTRSDILQRLARTTLLVCLLASLSIDGLGKNGVLGVEEGPPFGGHGGSTPALEYTTEELLQQYLERNAVNEDEGLPHDGLTSETNVVPIVMAQDGGRSSARFLQGTRQMIGCPEVASSGQTGKLASMAFYSPKEEDTKQVYESKRSGWNKADIKSIVDFGLDLGLPTLAIMGGWGQSGRSTWIQEFKLEYERTNAAERRERPDYNLLIFDWSAYGVLRYGTSAGYVPHLGTLLAKFLGGLIEGHGYNVSQIHLLSFSLSTHITGVAGRALRSKYGKPIAQITALDPTGVCFHDGSKFARNYALRPSDASLVVARHYNMWALGSRRLIGGVDIVVNDGQVQPSMWSDRFPIGINSHLRATKHEVASFDPNSDCHEIAYECASHASFLAGECGHCGQRNQSCMPMGTISNFRMGQHLTEMNYKPNTAMHITTGWYQFCEYNYQVVMRLEGRVSAATINAFKAGKFSFRLDALDVSVEPKNYVESQEEGGGVFTQLLQPGNILAKFPDRVKVAPRARPLLKSVKFVAIRYLSHLEREVRRRYSVQYCPDNEQGDELIVCVNTPQERRKRPRKN